MLIKKFENWVSSSTISSESEDFPFQGPVEVTNFDYDFTHKDHKTYGIHKIGLTNPNTGVNVKVTAKFDTGAASSSIDFSVAKKLGFPQDLINICMKLDKVPIDKKLTSIQQKQLEAEYDAYLKKRFPLIEYTKVARSSSGFSIRAFIHIHINYNNKIITTNVNLRDRTGMSCEMILGLKDM